MMLARLRSVVAMPDAEFFDAEFDGLRGSSCRPGDPDFETLSQRTDAERINWDLDDTLWLRRAYSVVHVGSC